MPPPPFLIHVLRTPPARPRVIVARRGLPCLSLMRPAILGPRCPAFRFTFTVGRRPHQQQLPSFVAYAPAARGPLLTRPSAAPRFYKCERQDTVTLVFIGGSISIRSLSTAVQRRLSNIIERCLPVIIGDAPGADSAVQHYFAERKYANVTVFHMGIKCRNNYGGWPRQQIRPMPGLTWFESKDRAMAERADYGQHPPPARKCRTPCRFGQPCSSTRKTGA